MIIHCICLNFSIILAIVHNMRCLWQNSLIDCLDCIISGLGMFRCFVVVNVTMTYQCVLLDCLVGHSDISIRFIMAGTMMSID